MNDELQVKEPVRAPLYFVGIGASAGGLEALELFFAHMAPDSGLAFVVIQHLSPDYKSLMVELLSKRTPMTVRRAEEGMVVEADTVYLIPPKKQLKIFHGALLLNELDYSKGINLPIDIFLRSLADDQAEKAIAVILSGTGSDGVRGIRSIKENGGMVMVQTPESARFDGMPKAALATGLVDVQLAPEEMPDRLFSFTRRIPAPVALPPALVTDEDSLRRIFALLRDQTRVDFTLYKQSTVLRRIERRMTVNQVADLQEYVRLLEVRSGEVNTLYRELLIGVTSFFRDREVFDEISTLHLTGLLQNAKNREVRFWVAACSTGEEAYTLAILARECMERLDMRASVKIFATDIDRDAIIHAGNGIYPESIAADLPPGLLARYFVRQGDHYQVERVLREMVVFAQHNLVKDPPFTNIDLLSCRNLLIYLQPPLQQEVLSFANFSLNPQGILLLGTSETPGELADCFETLHHKFKIYRSLGRKRPLADGQQIRISASEVALGKVPLRTFRSGRLPTLREDERIQDRLLQALAEEFAPLVAVVNERLELLHLAGNPDGFLRLPAGKPLNDISRMAVKELSIPLSTGLQRVFTTGKEMKFSRIRIPAGSGRKAVQMRLRLLPARKGQEPMAAVFLLDSAKEGARKSAVEVQEFDLGREAEQRIQDLEQELQFSKENLQATIEELETSNEELQATNEELLASNEELQSTNEELQSVNEELHTVNAEYQSKILELTEMTNDLNNLISATGIGTLFLDENLSVRKFTPELERVFKIIPSDAGRPFSHLTHHLAGEDPQELARKVEKDGATVEREVRTKLGDWFLMRVLPYRIGKSSTSGVVFTFTDINPIKQSQEALDTSDLMLRKSQEMAHVGSWRLDLAANRLEWSEEVYRIFGLKMGDLQPTYETFLSLVHPEDRARVDGAYRQAVRESQAYETIHRIRRPDGSVRVVREKSEERRDGQGVAFASYGMVHDITESIEIEEALRVSQAFLRSALDSLSAHIAILDGQGRIIYVNEAWRQFSRDHRLASPGHGVGVNYLEVCDAATAGVAEARAVAVALREMLAGQRQAAEIEYPCHSPTQKGWFAARFQRFDAGQGPRIVVAHENITQRKLAELCRESRNLAQPAENHE
jgi:two-component system CheB/CheR fusion protein